MFASRTEWKLAQNRFSAALERLRSSGREVLDLTESNPTRCGFVYDPEWLRALGDPRGLVYEPQPKGLLAAREAICAYYRERGVGVDPEQVILTASTSEAYSFLFRLLCDAGDEVLVPAPSYPLFEFLGSIQDVKLVTYPLIYDHGWQLDQHSLAAAISGRTRAVLVVHPNNPTGSFVKPGDMGALDLCAERQVALIADEVFLDYSLATPASSFAGEHAGLTFTLSGISKICCLPQMKLAWIVASGPPQQVKEALARLEIIADTYLSVSTPVQLALPDFLARKSSIQQQVHERISANLAELDRQLRQHSTVRRLALEGGWYAVLRVPVTRSDEELAIELLERPGVVVHPGHFYDFLADGYLVLSLITKTEVFGEGLGRALESF
jgi:alanine-synthesizing transaminase